MVKKILAVFVFGLVLMPAGAQQFDNQYLMAYDSNSRKYTRYDYIYQSPSKQSLGAYGRYIMTNGSVRYINSPSKLKNAAHTARINAYNRMYAY